jgi:hypothetical protein
MKNNCVKCEAQRITQESLSDKGPDEINQNLLSDLFDLVYFIYGEFRCSDRYEGWEINEGAGSTVLDIDRDLVLGVVGAAIDKAEVQAVEAWREEQRKQRENYEQRNHGED